MAKVKQKAAKASAKTASTRAAQVAKERNKHKVVVETTSKEEKKLRSVITFRADPPPGYTFIPAGNPELTAALKEFSRRGDHKIFAVTTTPHAARHELSREVHRIGFHFPTSIVAQVCAHYGIRLTSGGKVIDESTDDKEDRLFAKVYQNGQRPPKEEKDQVTINTEAKQTIKDLFPKIPDNDLFQIIKTAFQLGDNKVGTADEIPLVRRAQLSVVAHIRHCYTKYDKLLRQLQYNEARHAVERETLAKLIEWRGDDDTIDDNARRAADDLLREVIVISDEEESESDAENAEQIVQGNVRVEELPSNAYGEGPARAASPLRHRPGRPAGQEYQILPNAVRRYKPSDDMIAQRDRSRYAVWDQARRDYRSGANRPPVTVLERVYEPIDVPTSRILVPLDPPTLPPAQVVHAPPPRATMSRIDYEPHPAHQSSPRTYIRDANGVLYERIDTRPYETHPDMLQRPLDRVPPGMVPSEALRVRTRPSSPQGPSYQGHRQGGEFDAGNGTIVQSIEGQDGAYLPSTSRTNPFQGYTVRRDTNTVHETARSYRDVPVIDLTESNDQTSRHRRLGEVLAPPEYRNARRGSPARLYDRSYVPHSQAGSAYDHPLVLEYGEPRPAPPSVDTPRYVEHRPLDRGHDASNASTAVRGQMDGAYDVREPARMQPRHVSHVQASRGLPEVEMNMSSRAPNNGPAVVLSREPLPGNRGYEERSMLNQHVAAREQYVQYLPEASRARHVYASDPAAHRPIQGSLHHRAYDHPDASATNICQYTHVAR